MERHRFIPVLVVSFTLAAAACDNPAGPKQPLPVTRIMNGTFSHAPAPQKLVLRTAREFQDAWAAMFVNVTMPPIPLDVDFSSEMVIIVQAGPKPTSGFCIAVDAASGDRRSMDVRVRSSGPTPQMGVLPVITHPFDVVRVPRRDAVRFDDVSEVGNCGLGA